LRVSFKSLIVFSYIELTEEAIEKEMKELKENS
jgi:hypothetical protein